MAIRYIDEYTDGVLTAHIPYEVSDAELRLEEIDKEVNEANDNALVAYNSYANLTAAQKDKILKGLLGDYIRRHKERYL